MSTYLNYSGVSDWDEWLAQRSWSAAGAVEAMRDWRGRAVEMARRAWVGLRRLWWRGFWQLDVRGVEHVPATGPVLLCANHCSHLDAPAILAALPRGRALTASAAAAQDVFGRSAARSLACRITTNAVLVQREAEFAGGLRQLDAVLRSGRALVLFPEGKRSGDGRLGSFRCGAAMLALRNGAPVVPICLSGMRRALPKGSAVPRPGKVCVRFGQAIDPGRYRQAIAAGRMSRHAAYAALTGELREAVWRLGEEGEARRAGPAMATIKV